MVLGLGSKKGATVKVEFLIQIQEIKPWKVPAVNKPLVVQWQRGDNRYGKTKSAVPSEEDGGKILFNDGFRLPATLVRESEGKGRNAGIARFQKKTVVFTLLEATSDLQLARCVLDLAEYGDLDSRVPASIPLAVGKKVATGGQTPALFITIGPFKLGEKSFNSRASFGSSTPRNSISRGPEPKAEARPSTSGKSKVEPALDDETRKSIVAALLSDDDDNVSIESFTDDEGTPGSSTPGSETTLKSSTQGSVVSKIPPTAPKSEAPKPFDIVGGAIPVRKHPSFTADASPTPKPSNVAADAISSTKLPDSTADGTSKVMNRRNSTSPPYSASKPSDSSPESSSKSLNVLSSTSSSTSLRGATQAAVEAPVSSINPSYRRPIPTKHGSGKGTQIKAPVAAEEKAEERADGGAKDKVEETAVESKQPLTRHPAHDVESTAARDEASQFPRSAVPISESVTKLFSTEKIYKPAKGVDSSALQPMGSKVKDDSSISRAIPESALQPMGSKIRDDSNTSRGTLESRNSSKPIVKEQHSSKKQDEASHGLSLTDSASINIGNTGKANRSSPDSMESSGSVTSRPTDRSRSNSMSESPPPLEVPRTELEKSPKGSSPKGRAHEDMPASPALPSPPAAKASSRGMANIAKKAGILSNRSSSDFSNNGSDDFQPESVLSGRSKVHSPVHDTPKVLEMTTTKSGSANPVSAVIRTDNEGSKTAESQTGSQKTEASSTGGKKRPDAKTIDATSTSLNSSKDVFEVVPAKDSILKQEEPQEEGASVLGSARANLAKVEKRALDELRTKVASVEAKLVAETQKVEKLRGELQDIGAMEVSLYTIVAEHGNSAHKLHTPARRLARLYMHAYKNWTPERRAGTAKNSISGLLTVARSCGSDVSRLNFWWSNVVVLRTVLVQAIDNGLSSGISPVAQTSNVQSGLTIDVNGKSSSWAKPKTSVFRPSYSRRSSSQDLPKKNPSSTDWQTANTYISALEKIEEWIYSKIVESLWWQAMIPRMQKNVDTSAPSSPRGMAMLSPSALFGSEFTNKAKEDLSKMAGDVTGIFVRKPSRKVSVSLPELGDARQGNHSAEVWKKAITEALCRLCPVRGAGHDCGCLPMLVRMAIEGCVERLDVALFNAILREPEDDVPTDPISDPVSDPNVLPISAGGLTFGGGVQLKNVVVTWSSFIMGLVKVKEPVFEPDTELEDNAEEDTDKSAKFFKLIKATGDLLMLPKDSFMDKNMRKEETKEEPGKIANLFVFLKSTGDILQLPKDLLMDRSVRREICPMLSVELIRRILVNFSPDEFAPDPIAPSLLAALNTEASLERQRHGEAFDISASAPIASAPSVTYIVPSAQSIWPWIGEWSPEPPSWGRSSKSLLRKGYTSDEDLSVMKSVQNSSAGDKLEFLTGNLKKGKAESSTNGSHKQQSPRKNQHLTDITLATRFELLEEVWENP